MARRGRVVRALAAAWLVGSIAVGCAISTSASGTPTAAVDEGSFPIDESPGDEQFSDELPPTLAPVPSGATASPACDAAFLAWVTWWQAFMASTDPSDPDATPSGEPPGDPDQLEHAVFDRCSVEDMAAANVNHPIVVDPDESPIPYIDYDVGWFVDGMCQDDTDIIGDTKLCQGRPSPSP